MTPPRRPWLAAIPAGRGPGGNPEGHYCLGGCRAWVQGPFCRDCWPPVPYEVRAWAWRSWHSGERADSAEHSDAMQAAVRVASAIRAALEAVNAARSEKEAA